MKLNLVNFTAAALLTLAVGPAVANAASGAAPSLLDTLERGLWQLRGIGGKPANAGVSQLCLGNPYKLTQIRHGDATCSRIVLKSTPDLLTVSYTCRGQGQGVTTIRKESSKIIHIQSQGIRNSSPFAFSVEGRKDEGRRGC